VTHAIRYDESTPLQRILDLPFAEIDGRELLLNVLRPLDRGDPVLPGVIYVHGGGWAVGHRTDTPNDLLAIRGFVTISISYRFSQDAVFPAALHDVKAAIRWVRANASDLGIDPDGNRNRIGIWGHSSGGHLASMAALTGDLAEMEGEVGVPDISSAVQAAVPIAGPSWFMAEDMYGDDAVERLLGVHQAKDPELGRYASPAGHVHAGAPPFLIVHGEADTVVPLSQSQLLYERLRDAGVESESIVVPGAGHGYQDLLTPEVVDRVASFFESHLMSEVLKS
jgi:acetyl esterase/lipase